MKKLLRSKSNRMIAGICGGLADYFNVDATIIRLACVFLGAITAFLPLMIAYIIAWFIIPDESEI